MKDFCNIQFQGQFRSYQKRIIQRAPQYLNDHKIHIVAPPGSGKTILGLELIRMVKEPALILSPSLIIRDQWKDKLEQYFLKDESSDEYCSFDIHHPQLLTSITYQALYAYYEKIDQDKALTIEQIIQQYHIKTICLDEAHHLKSEWQKVLENLISHLPQDCTIIALTATPPYDSTPQQWKRYIHLCGDIDEEISVPELVVQKNLCPHQDYIYLNTPTRKETKIIKQYQEQMQQCVQDLFCDSYLQEAITLLHQKENNQNIEEILLEHIPDFVSLFAVANYAHIPISKKLIRIISPREKLPACTLLHVQQTCQLIIDHPEIFNENISYRLKTYLTCNHFYTRKQVQLMNQERINKLLISSKGKLQSLQDIVAFENDDLKTQLRLLILTDHIQKELTSLIGTDQEIMSLGCLPIFEVLRRAGYQDLAVLSGSCIIIPIKIQSYIEKLAYQQNITCTFHPFLKTNYCQVTFSGEQKGKVNIITQAFKQGYIRIIVGTKSLLGEGWDCPCINALILATTVGSFVLSNQMRGRAMRISDDPHKTSHIWHLVTIESSHHSLLMNDEMIQSYDYDILKRRFDCFIGPAYHQNVIENGIERIDMLCPPFTKNNIIAMNQQTLAYAKQRQQLEEQWYAPFQNQTPQVRQVNKVSPKVQPTGYLYQNMLLCFLIDIIFALITKVINQGIYTLVDNWIKTLAADFLLSVIGYFLVRYQIQLLQFLSPKKIITGLSQCLFKTLQDIGEIKSQDASLHVEIDDEGEQFIYTMLHDASLKEQNLFSIASQQLFSSIDNPRYIIIKHVSFLKLKKCQYTLCYACPDIIGANKENAQIFLKHLQKIGDFTLVYTRTQQGRKELLKCRRYSYLHWNDCYIKGKKVLRKDWE